MVVQNLEDFPKEKLQEIYEILPKDLQQALFSQEIADIINDICKENNFAEKQISKVLEYVGHVLLGLLSPNDFEKNIKEKLFLKDGPARQICRQIIRSVFIPLKTSLELIHKTQINLPPFAKEKKEEKKEKMVAEKKETIKERLPVREEPPTSEEPSAQAKSPVEKPKRDSYREPIK